MSSFLIDIERFDKLSKKATLSELRKLVTEVFKYSQADDGGCIVGNTRYYIQMPNTVHSFYLTEKEWKTEARKAVINSLRKGQNWIDFEYYFDETECKKDLAQSLRDENKRLKMFIDHNIDAINALEK